MIEAMLHERDVWLLIVIIIILLLIFLEKKRMTNTSFPWTIRYFASPATDLQNIYFNTIINFQ